MNDSQIHIMDGSIERRKPIISFSHTDKADTLHWFVMRDLKRSNAKLRAYEMFDNMKIENFTPKVWKLVVRNGKRIRVEVPFIQDLLFVHNSRNVLDPIVENISTLQYRFIRGAQHTPMIVDDRDMERFMKAVEITENPHYYIPKELDASMIGKRVRIVGGPFDGYEGNLQKLRGTKVKRIFIELPTFVTLPVEINPEYIQLL